MVCVNMRLDRTNCAVQYWPIHPERPNRTNSKGLTDFGSLLMQILPQCFLQTFFFFQKPIYKLPDKINRTDWNIHECKNQFY